MRYEFTGFRLDTDARELWSGDRPLHLSGKAFDLLKFLIEQRPRVVNKRELYDHLWPDTFVVDGSLPVLVREIRSHLGDSRRVIRTVHGHGYAFAANARELFSGRDHCDAGPLHLLVHAEREFRLRRGENVVGRDPVADVFLPSTSVSRRHAFITVEGDIAIVADLQSKNGTRIDGAVVTTAVQLRNGSVVTFGSIEMV